ncbi:MAG: polyphosphate kinase 2 family protein [Coriobacteriia bacterium]|nr:polyphosphate kinase 2 family protein [Coriobacteriia bacterium]
MKTTKFIVDGSTHFDLAVHPTTRDKQFRDRQDGIEFLQSNAAAIAEHQSRLNADGRAGVLVLFQGMDASGKDGAIRTVFSQVSQSGLNVVSFKRPTHEELAHDYLWRLHRHMPQRGYITVFNRSHYEDVLIVRVHRLYEELTILDRCKGPDTIERRYRQICDYERYLWENGIVVLKFMLHISKKEQAKRLLSRIDDPYKNWKFESDDIAERERWDDYQCAYEDALNATATPESPWYVIPADTKWFARAAISQIIRDRIEELNPQFPVLDVEDIDRLTAYRRLLMSECGKEIAADAEGA